MHVQKIQIRNVRGFQQVDLDLTRPDGTLAGWTVLAGRNGSGKSTLLKAVAFNVAGSAVASALAGGFSGWIRKGENEASVKTTLETSADEDRSFGGLQTRVRTVEPQMTWRTDEPSLTGGILMSDGLSLGPLSARQGSKGWFLAGYGPYRRLSGHATDAQRLMAGPDQIARLVSLFREDASLVECVQWLREIYLRRLEDKPGAAELEQAVLALLNDGRLLPGGLRVEGIDSEALWVSQCGVRLPLDELSDGYRTVAALVMDIVRHLHRCFGELQIESAKDPEGTYQRVLHHGVVLIDEVDLHLHVSWQQRIGFWLKRHFPNIQFIVTTHSPFICQAADPRGLIRLPAPGEDRPVEHVSEDLYNTVVNGSLDEAVLTDLFGLETPYSEPAERLRERIAQLEVRLQTGKATDQDRLEHEDLHAQLPETPTTAVEQALRRLVAGS